MSNQIKVCPMKFGGERQGVYAQDPCCNMEKCAWWCAFTKDCSIPVIAGILADSTICQNTWRETSMLASHSSAPQERVGWWMPVPSSDLSTGRAYKCSECNAMRYGSFFPPYCQMCGAHMTDGVEGDEK
nr:MAG TPA: hypothetical protein [Myoviridae sp. ct6nn14]